MHMDNKNGKYELGGEPLIACVQQELDPGIIIQQSWKNSDLHRWLVKQTNFWVW